MFIISMGSITYCIEKTYVLQEQIFANQLSEEIHAILNITHVATYTYTHTRTHAHTYTHTYTHTYR